MTEPLDPLLQALAEEDARICAPPPVGRAVMEAWEARSASLPASAGRFPWLLVPAAAALVAAIVAFDTGHRRVDPATGDGPARRSRGGDGLAGLGDGAWYVLVNDPAADADALSVVRLRMSRTALASLGVPVPNPDAAALVDVDVVLGEDGVARAIQPVTLVGFVQESIR